MDTHPIHLGPLNSQPGRIAVVIEPRPCGGPLAYRMVTHPAALHVRSGGIDLRPAGAFTQGNQLHCEFKTQDLGRALPALMNCFAQIELAGFCKFGYRLPDQPGRFIERWRDVDPSRSYVKATAATWRDRIHDRLNKAWTSGWLLRRRVWCRHQIMFGNLHRALHAAALGLAATCLVAYLHFPALALAGWTLSILCAFASHLARPLLPRAVVERQLEAGMERTLAESATVRQQIAEMHVEPKEDDV